MQTIKNIVRIALIITTTFLLIPSCTEIIDLELKKGDNLKLVVDAWISNTDYDQIITLSLSTDYFDLETPTEAEGATVSVSSSRRTYTFTERNPGSYYMDDRFDGMVGETFTLNIDYNGESYTASHDMNRVPEIEDINYVLYEEADSTKTQRPGLNPDNHDEWDIHATIQEIPGKGDYYYFGNYEKSAGPQTNLYLGEYTDDEFFDGAYIEDSYVTYGFFEPGDVIITQIFSISEEVYDYFTAVDNQTDFRGFIFDSPPANVTTNISNGGKGFFIVSAVDEFEKELE